MKKYISETEVFITYGSRSAKHYHSLLTEHIIVKFGEKEIEDPSKLRHILLECYDWCAKTFADLILAVDDKLLVISLFAYHESSVSLWIRLLSGENIEQTLQITEDELAMNRRVFRLALEQTIDVNYIRHSPVTSANLQIYDDLIEDLLFLGEELFGFGYQLAELRMIREPFKLNRNENGYLFITRRDNLEGVMSAIITLTKEDNKLGIFDQGGVNDLKSALLHCMGIDYDFAGHQLITIKKHHSPIGWEFQTIEPGILIQNQVAFGADNQEATNFFAGLTLNRHNKLSVKDAVYKVNSLERYFFRPILVITENGVDRELIGRNKWAESITVLTTNGFQWGKAPEEWKRNICFARFINQKEEDHDRLLEDEVEKILNQLQLPFDRTITTVTDVANKSVNIEVPGIGEIDFIWVDVARNVMVVADCKYNRSRYDMIGYSTDYSNFKQTYETQITNKVNWVRKNLKMICEHLTRKFPTLQLNPSQFRVEGLFIINSPTFYLYHGDMKTVCFFRLAEMIRNNYNRPDLVVKENTNKGIKISIKKYPYFA
jgi:hypothetical protein